MDALLARLLIERGCFQPTQLAQLRAEQPQLPLDELARRVGVPAPLVDELLHEARRRFAGEALRTPASTADSRLTLDGARTQAGAPPPPVQLPPEAAPPPLPGVGERVAGYLLEAPIAAGGMGAVFRAVHPELAKPVAIKFLLAGEGASDAQLQRFRLEAQATARLRHPNVVAVHDAGVDARGRAYLVMDFIEGRSLHELVAERGRFEELHALELVAKLADAVQEAHEQRIVHRDLKPANVMLEAASGEPLLTDFGIAKELGRSSGLTQDGDAVGTPAYMAPEQAAGTLDRIGPHTDVYGLGAILYELLVERPPLGHIRAAAQAVFAEPIRPRRLRPELSRDLETICLTCLEKDPGHRYPSAAELAADVRRFLAHEPIRARPVGLPARAGRALRRHRRGVLLGLIIAAGLGLAAASPWAWQTHTAARLRRAEADARAAADEAATELGRSLAERLDALERALRAGREPATAELTDAAAQESRLRDGEGLLRALLARGRASGGDVLSEETLARAAQAALSRLDRKALLARAALLRSELAAARGAEDAAQTARISAYILDPGGEHGAKAYLSLGDAFAVEEPERALPAFRAVASQTRLPPALRARAELGAAEAAVRVGRRREAWDALDRAQQAAALDANDAARVAWLRSFLEPLQGRAVYRAPGLSGALAWRPLEWERDLLVLHAERRLLCVAWDPGAERLTLTSQTELEGPILSTALLRSGEGLHLVATAHTVPERNQPALFVFDFVGTRLRLRQRHRVDFRGVGTSVPMEIAAVGDFDGDGEDEVLVRQGAQRLHDLRAFDRVLAPGARAREFFAGSWPGAVLAHDLDGDGRDEAIIGNGPWQDFDLRVLAWQEEGPGLERAPPLLAGDVQELVVRPGRPPFEFLALTERKRDYAAGPAAAPRFSDALWRLRADSLVLAHADPPRLTRYGVEVEGPLRLKGLNLVGGLVEGRPRALAFLESWHREVRSADITNLVIDADDGSGRLSTRVPASGLRVADLDGDSDPELVLLSAERRDAARLVVLGLRALAGADQDRGAGLLEQPEGEATPLRVAHELLRLGHAQAAQERLEGELRSSGRRDTTRAAIEQLLATALAAQGRPEAARELCLELARREPRLARELLLRAAAYADVAGRPELAIADLEALQERFRPGPAEAREIERRLRCLRPLVQFEDLLDLDPEDLREPELPLLVERPLLMHWTAESLRFLPRHGVKPELSLPLRYDGSSLRLRARFRVERVEWAVGFKIHLNQVGDEEETDGLEISVGCGGGGNVDTFRRVIGAALRHRQERIGDWLELEDFAPELPIEVDILYRAGDGQLHLEIEQGELRRRVVRSVPGQLDSGRYRLRIGQLHPHGVDDDPGANGAFRWESLRLQGPPGALRVDPAPARATPRGRLRAACRWLVVGADERVARELARLADEAPEVAREARFFRAVALARQGLEGEALAELSSLEAERPDVTDALWLRSLYAIDRLTRDVLARAYFARAGQPEPSPAVARAFLRKQDGTRAVLAFQAAGEPEGAARLEAALAWFRAGGYAVAFEYAQPFAAEGEPVALFLAGLTAFRLGDYANTVRYWDALEAREPERLVGVRVEHARARRLLEQAR